ncbi:S-methyl-5'-thioinosine phosphorylase [Marinihelvus fidelis]|uniref:Probable S-methyl-5'-thioinosine phosphorylase n=1 Tax=Marinihelvus fidelis TaxID=2613842 RepID=A0A5N0TE49_9GAMM|nr:S-methyl-5'-thioinosine phosphorylase [Marinihelvus fidelis]KAA9133260.1 S-methyl-5'-thioinosine phosphorylase [Marinihelvus fidelis]
MAVIGLVGGTGFDHWGEPAEARVVATRWGAPSDALMRYEAGSHTFWFLARHRRDHSIPPHRVDYRANIAALAKVGVERIIAVNAVGGITERYDAGVLALPDQLVDYTWGRAQTFSDDDDEPLQHIEFAQPFDAVVRAGLVAAAADAGVAVETGGCLGVTQGPRLETAAEIRRLRRDGCDLVGMTSMPEAALARELSLPYAAIAVVSNRAAGLEAEPVTMEAISATMANAIGRVHALLDHLPDD